MSGKIEEYFIDFTINDEGEVSSKVSGIQGPSCGAVMQPFQELGQRIHDSATSEFYAQPTVDDRAKQSTGVGARRSSLGNTSLGSSDLGKS